MKKSVISVFIIVTLSIGLFQLYNSNVQLDGKEIVVKETKKLSLNEFLTYYNSGEFGKVEISDNTLMQGYKLVGKDAGNMSFMTLKKNVKKDYYNVYETNKSFSDSLQSIGISMTGSTLISLKNTEKSMLQIFFEGVGPIIFVLILLVLLAKFFLPKGGGGLPFGFKVGKLSEKSQMKTKFSDVAGMDEVKGELMEIVDYLKNPEKYKKVGARHPKGVLLYGQPGSGKTLLARAVSGEADVPFFNASGSEFMEMLVGMGAAKVRDLFGKAKKSGSAIIFIDEIDAIGKKRGGGYTGGHQEQEQTLNQILTEMDGFDNTTNIVVIAATNRPDVLDPALLRSGRFDRKILVGAPTLEERVSIFEYYLKGKKIDGVDIKSLSKRTTGLVGADIENIINEASLKIAKDGRETIQDYDFEYALEKVLMGPEKKIKSIIESEKKIIAFHELGHALTANSLKNADPVEKISIISRGQALGVTWTIPSEDKYLHSKSKFIDEVITLLGGRAAEEVYFGKEEITTGASNDFEKATEIVKNMIIKYGMDDDIGMTYYYSREYEDNPIFKPFSEKTAQIIDEKIKKYLDDCYQKSKDIIQKNKNLIEKMSEVLLEKEYLTKDDFLAMIGDPSKIEKLLHEAIEYKNKIKINKEQSEKDIKKELEENPKKVDTDQVKQAGGFNLKNILDKYLG